MDELHLELTEGSVVVEVTPERHAELCPYPPEATQEDIARHEAEQARLVLRRLRARWDRDETVWCAMTPEALAEHLVRLAQDEGAGD